MKKVLCMFTLCLGMVACSEGSSRTMVENDVAKTGVVEVIYFHGARRCATCMAIEEKTQEVIDSIFAEELKHGTLSFRSVNLSEEEALAEKYKVTWSALILVDYDKGGDETITNLTEFAFSSARTAPDRFKLGLSEQLTEMLRN